MKLKLLNMRMTIGIVVITNVIQTIVLVLPHNV